MDGSFPSVWLRHVLLADFSFQAAYRDYHGHYRNPELKARIDDFNTHLSEHLDDTNFVLPATGK